MIIKDKENSIDTICFVGSTLPAGFISSQIDNHNIKCIYLASKELIHSYNFLLSKNPSLKLIFVPTGFLAKTIFLTMVLISIRLNNKKIFFFHECCFPVFDLLLWVIKTRGYFFPQVSMSAWKEINPYSFPKSKTFYLLRLFHLFRKFRFYESPSVHGLGKEYVIAIRSYPSTIVSMPPSFSHELVSKTVEGKLINENKIIFIVGKSSVSDERQAAIVQELVSLAISKGYVCCIKDHPNPRYRVNLEISGVIVIDPYIPVEILKENYYLAVGVSSSSLLRFGARGVSLIKMLDNKLSHDSKSRIKHFDSFVENNINYINTVDEFGLLL